MPANDNGTVTEENASAQTALDGLRARSAASGPIAQPAIEDAIRRAAAEDLDAQYPDRRQEPTRERLAEVLCERMGGTRT
jgi:hypothetical protein